MNQPFQIGDRVTNSSGWHGHIVRVDTFEPFEPNQDGYYWHVHWWERACHEDKLVRKLPVLGHLTEQLTLVEANHE